MAGVDIQHPFDDLKDTLACMDTQGVPLLPELSKLCSILPHDQEMGAVRGRRIVDMVFRALYAKHLGAVGTRPLDTVISELEKGKLVPREVAAHARSLKEIANLCAHDGSTDVEGVTVCLIDLVVILKWYIRYLQAQTRASPSYQAVDGVDLSDEFSEIDQIFAIDAASYGELEEVSLGTRERSRSWFRKNPQVYTLLMAGAKVVGYTNIMPLEDDAFALAVGGRLHDGLISADMIRTFELPGPYNLYICSLAILPEHRRYPTAFRTLYDGVFEKLFRLAEVGIYVARIAGNAWSLDGRSLARSFGMSPSAAHEKQGEVYCCAVVPPEPVKPGIQLRHLLNRYRELGIMDE